MDRIDFSSWSDVQLAAACERHSRLVKLDGTDPSTIDLMVQLEEALRARGIDTDDVIEDLHV